MTARSISYEDIVKWLIPFLLSGVLGVLGWIGSTISDMNKTLAVAVQRVDDLDRRVTKLEGK